MGVLDSLKAAASKPQGLLILGAAIIGGVFLASRMRKKDSGDGERETVIAYNQAPVTDIADEERLEELRRQIADLKFAPTNPRAPQAPDVGGDVPSPRPPPKPPTTQPKPPTTLPQIVSFVASPNRIAPGGSSTLSWSVKNASSVKINGNAVAGNSLVVKPALTTIYTLVAGNVSRSLSVTVAPKSDRGRPAPLPGVPTPAPQQPAPQQPAPQQPARPDIPGGYPDSFQGVADPPADHPGANVVGWIHSSKNPAQRSGKALGWAVAGIGSAPIPTKLQPMSRYLNNPANWSQINGIRRARGLRPLNRKQFQDLAAFVATQAKSGRDSFPDSFIATLWEYVHMPFLKSERNPRLR